MSKKTVVEITKQEAFDMTLDLLKRMKQSPCLVMKDQKEYTFVHDMLLYALIGLEVPVREHPERLLGRYARTEQDFDKCNYDEPEEEPEEPAEGDGEEGGPEEADR